LPVEAIEAALRAPLVQAADPAKPQAPGQLSSHYAPAASVQLNITKPDADALWLGFGPYCEGATLNLSRAGDMVEAAANLFGMLHDLDDQARHQGMTSIAVAPIPNRGLGLAINDRLKRAAAPRR
jgi:L-threonylcarbamoyladenylate synthase